MTDIQKQLFELCDEEYRRFHSGLMPGTNINKIIGVRTPVLRQYAKKLFRDEDARENFLSELPHKYYEENNLHALLISQIKDFDKVIFLTEKFLPYIDNWATCDMFCPAVFKNNSDKLILKTDRWLASGRTFTIRYGIGMLMRFFLDERFNEKYLLKVAGVKSDEYYVQMMQAWYFATAIAKQYDSAVLYLEQNKLCTAVHNKTISKCIESYRVPDSVKDYLRTLRRKA